MFASTRATLKTLALGLVRPASDAATASQAGVLGQSNQATLFECYVCDSPMVLIEAQDIPEFGVTDLRLHTMQCDTCGMMADRVYHHMVGYDHGLVL